MGSGDCGAPLGQAWITGPTAGGSGCSGVNLNNPAQLTLCASLSTNGTGNIFNFTYVSDGLSKAENAKKACEDVNGVGACDNIACGSCHARGYHKSGTPTCNGSTYWNYADLTQTMGCGWVDPTEILVSLNGSDWGQDVYTNGMGGQYVAGGTIKSSNALKACESWWGRGQCCNDGCGSCDNKGYHKCGTPNCNGSIYWNYADTTQDMSCNWSDPAEVLISTDGVNWTQ
jgi:hypothetical protein